MIKTLATLTALTALTFFPVHAQAGDKQPATFKASILVDQTVSIEESYKSIQRQTRNACKRQIRNVKTFSTRFNYLRDCQAELMDASVKQAKNVDLSRYHASLSNPAKVKQFASTLR